MKRIDYLMLITDLFSFKSVVDECDNEYILFSHSNDESIRNIKDKTAFESLENHIHLVNNVKKHQLDQLILIANNLGRAVLCTLKSQYPSKCFMVYVTISLNDCMIIRFHQKWIGEEPFCCPSDFTSPKEKVFLFEG